jgi:hypothetical protein
LKGLAADPRLMIVLAANGVEPDRRRLAAKGPFDGLVRPSVWIRKEQAPPDLHYFKPTGK